MKKAMRADLRQVLWRRISASVPRPSAPDIAGNQPGNGHAEQTDWERVQTLRISQRYDSALRQEAGKSSIDEGADRTNAAAYKYGKEIAHNRPYVGAHEIKYRSQSMTTSRLLAVALKL